MGEPTPPPARVGRKSYEAGFKSFEPQAIVVDYRRGPRRLGKSLYFVTAHAAPSCSYGGISPGVVPGWICADVASRVALSSSERALGRSGGFRPGHLSRALAPASPSETLHLAYRRRLARGGSHHAAARRREGGPGVRTEARRLDRGAAQAPAERRHRSRTGWRCRCAASRTASCIGAASVGRCGSKQTPSAPGSCAWPASRRTSTAASTIFSSARRSASRVRPGATRASSASPSSASACAVVEPLGLVFQHRRVVLLWRLILAPPFVLDYLAAHEVCHLVELNHSLRFWRLVKRLYPNVEPAKAWLDVNGTDLHRYGLAGRRRAGDI